jgi:hypothetical protein
MKKLLIIATIIFAASLSNGFAQSVKEVKLATDKQAVDKGSKFTFKLIEVEDSRCPPDTNCIWAGNAKVKFSIAKGKGAAKIFELNSAIDPKPIVFEGYEIGLKELSATPKSTDPRPIKYALKLSLKKMPKSK